MPKLIEVGVTASVPAVGAVTPVPAREMTTLGLEAFEEKPRLAVADPVEAGEKVTERLALWPEPRV